MFIGYADNHDADCYEMLDPVKGMVHLIQDIAWLDRMYYPKKNEGLHMTKCPRKKVTM